MDVLTAARERIKNVFNTAPKVYLSFSGGKDSIVLSDIIYKMCLAMQIDRRKLVVEFIDEEAIFPCVENIVKEWKAKWESIGVEFRWWCIEVKHFSCLNSLTQEETFICWDSMKQDKWVRPKPPGCISNHPWLKKRKDKYQDFLNRIEKDGISLIGIRTAESIQRVQNMAVRLTYKNQDKVFPIYDMKDSDVWLYILQNNLNIPDAYLYMWQTGRPKNRLRISQFFSIDTIGSLSDMAQYYPGLYEKICNREPNAYMAMLYYDTELYRRAKREKDTVDYKQKFFEYINSPAAKEQMAVRPKEFNGAYRLAQNMYMTQKTWKLLYNMIVGGDPKGRTYRAIATELQIARKDRS